jgi:hypothetical protein
LDSGLYCLPEAKIMKECCKKKISQIPDDEPVFCVYGRDILAVYVITEWLKRALECGVNTEKILDVVQHLSDIQKFQRENPLRVHLPD